MPVCLDVKFLGSSTPNSLAISILYFSNASLALGTTSLFLGILTNSLVSFDIIIYQLTDIIHV